MHLPNSIENFILIQVDKYIKSVIDIQNLLPLKLLLTDNSDY